MPLFNFICQNCGTPFEEWVLASSMVDHVECPECGSQSVQKQLSRVAGVKNGAGTSPGGTNLTSASCQPGGG